MLYRFFGWLVWRITVGYVRLRFGHLAKPALGGGLVALVAGAIAAVLLAGRRGGDDSG
ncbi:MAG TPA: hypothetical protein VK279_09535 [Solirubrobacteraceae bacterium]|nr:hypothetical protein [Solirubrobacteraceae bacterium]